jgi:diguanylate cyclase (GGDEF)-like protein
MRPEPTTMPVQGDAAAAGLEAWARELLDPFPVAVYLADGERLLYVSRQVGDLLGRPAEELLAAPELWSQVVHPDDRAAAPQGWSLPEGERVVADYRMVDRAGETRHVRDVRVGVAAPDGHALALGVVIEVGGPVPAGCHDTLTRLPNRDLMHEHLIHALARSRDEDSQLAMLHAGLDGFHLVNRSLGREAGDAVLREAAERLRAALPDTAVLARPGNDEFCILVPAATGEAEAVARATAGLITVALSRPFKVEGRSFQLGATIGASLYPQDALDADTLLQHADAALAQAKRVQRGTLGFYEGGTSEAIEQLMLSLRLQGAIEHDELVLHFQPIFRLPDHAIFAVEALLRWQDPTRGLVPPMDFIPVAEHTGLIEPIGRWVMRAVAEQARAWADEGIAVPIAFNVSPRQFRDPELASSVREAFAAAGVEPSAAILEITESTAMREPACVEPVLEELRAVGIRIAVDDFGTGYSSLSRLQEMEVDILKVDRALLPGDGADERGLSLASATLGLVEGLGLQAVAEGIESDEQQRFVTERGYPLAQGFHLARPMPAGEVAELLRASASTAAARTGPTAPS